TSEGWANFASFASSGIGSRNPCAFATRRTTYRQGSHFVQSRIRSSGLCDVSLQVRFLPKTPLGPWRDAPPQSAEFARRSGEWITGESFTSSPHHTSTHN